jgi:putative MATE family efflux protein
MVSQNILNLVDTGMVGSLGDDALAAVGLASMASFLSMAFIMGLSVGVQAMAARRMGEQRQSEMAVPLNGGLLLAATIAIPLSTGLIFAAPVLFPLLADHQEALVEIGVPYLQIRFVAILAVSCNFAFRGYWNGVNLSHLYMRTLIVMHVTNVFLNWVLIYGNLGAPELGATGAAVASAVATYLGLATYFTLGFKHARANGFLRGIPDRKTMATMLRLALPNGIQQVFFAAFFVTLFVVLARIGKAETAAANVLINITLVAYLPAMGLGISSASLVGQALGRKDPDDANRWAWDIVRIAVVLLFVIGMPMLLFPDAVLAPFIRTPSTVDLARPALRLVGATIFLDAIGIVLMQSLLGAGASRAVMLVSVVVQWGVTVPLFWLVGIELEWGLMGVWSVFIAQRFVVGFLFYVVWRRGAWKRIEV